MAPAGFRPPRWRFIASAGALMTLAAFAVLVWPRADRAGANPITGLVDIAAGEAHTCGLTAEGGVLCWGRNESSELGDGTTADHNVPVPVVGLEAGVLAVDPGGGFTCALIIEGGVRCWGSLGGLDDIHLVPTDLMRFDTDVVDLASGAKDMCVLVTSGQVLCWHTYEPVGFRLISGLGAVVDIVHGGTFGCALTQDGSVHCWEGILNSARLVPELPGGAVEVVAGVAHACGLLEDGRVRCWGNNRQGQLGDGTITDRETPVDVQGLPGDVARLAAGGQRTCALLEDGSVFCWGGADGVTPVEVTGFRGDVVQLAVGADHACARTAAGAVQCWGNNTRGQLGDGTNTGSAVPVDVVVSGPKPTPTPTPCPVEGCPTPPPRPPCPAEACMALAVQDDAGLVRCHSTVDDPCGLPAGSAFTLAVDAFAVPEEGYVLMQTFIRYREYDPRASEDGAGPGTCADGIDNGREHPFGGPRDESDEDCLAPGPAYTPTGAPADEVTWPDLAFAVRDQVRVGTVLHGGLTGSLPPLPVSRYTGNVVELAMTCSPYDSLTRVRLLPAGDRIALTNGALFSVLDEGTRTPRQIVPQVGALALACCDETISSTDAALILQMSARLIGDMPCDFEPDVNQDGRVNSIDALFVLQVVAGLLDALPQSART